MLSPLELSLAGAALLIGLTGAWSPCGFSMVETIGLSGDGARRRTTIASCATFAPGAVLGGIVTFGSLSGLGEIVHGVGGQAAYAIAAAIAVAAAVAEARGTRIAPQIRRQLPEGWRWTMPMPLAAALYGILLGLGFTTFVLSFGVWALAGIGFALADPHLGLVIGAAFGIGRAIPVVVVAPVVDSPVGVRCVELMAERPALYRIFRLGDAATLGLVAVALTATASATAARTVAPNGADPSRAGKSLAFQRDDRSGVLQTGRQRTALPGRDPALGGPYAAVISGQQIKILRRFRQREVGSLRVPEAEAVAISKGWLAYLTVKRGRYSLKARRIRRPSNPGKVKRIASAKRPSHIGHPSIGGARVFYAVSRRSTSSIKRRNLRGGKQHTVVRSRTAALSNPSVRGKRLLYVRANRARQGPQATRTPKLRQALVVKRIGRKRGDRIYSHRGRRWLWSTSLSRRRGYVTLLGAGGPKIVSVKR
jgi:hypothetical protein